MTDLEKKIAEYLKDRDEALTPDEADDEERAESAQVIAEMMFPMSTFQGRLRAIHDRLFEGDPTDTEERTDRFFEEATETAQAFGMDVDDAHRLVDYVFTRPVGERKKEVGAAFVTLTSLCIVADIDVMECAEADLEKLGRPESIERIRKKRSTRHGRGPLPGFD